MTETQEAQTVEAPVVTPAEVKEPRRKTFSEVCRQRELETGTIFDPAERKRRRAKNKRARAARKMNRQLRKK